MSITEHLIENAMTCWEEHLSKEYYLNNSTNQAMVEQIGVSLEIFWQIAEYMCVTYIPTLMSDLLKMYHIGKPFEKLR